LDHLVARSDSGTASDASDLCLAFDIFLLDFEVSVSFVSELTFWTLHQHAVADFHSVTVQGHLATFWEFGVYISIVNFD